MGEQKEKTNLFGNFFVKKQIIGTVLAIGLSRNFGFANKDN